MASLLRALTLDGWPNQSRASGWRARQDWSQSAWSRPVSSVSHQVSTRIQESNGKKKHSVDNTAPGLSLESIDKKNQQHATLDARQIFILSANNFSVQNMLLQASLHTTSQAPLPQVPLLFHPGADLAEVKLRSRCPLQGSTQGPCPVVSVLNTWMVNSPSSPFIWNLWNINFKVSMIWGCVHPNKTMFGVNHLARDSMMGVHSVHFMYISNRLGARNDHNDHTSSWYSTLRAQFLQPETYPQGTSRFFRATVRSRKIRSSMRLWDSVEARP